MAETPSPAPASGRPPKFGVALIPLVAMALLLGVGYGVYKIKAQVLLVAAASLTAVPRPRPRLQVEGHGAGHRRQHPQGHAGHPDHALRRHPGRLLDGQRHHPHDHLLRPQAHLAQVLPGHGLPGLLGRGRSPRGRPGGRSARSASPSSASPWASASRSARRPGPSSPAPISATRCRPSPTSPTWPRSSPGRTCSTTSST